jgi:hypothetical protein
MKTKVNSAVMKRLDALAKSNSYKFITAFIGPVFEDPNAEPLRVEAIVNLWDGVAGSGGKRITTLHATPDEAVNAVIGKYPHTKAVVFIDDLTQSEFGNTIVIKA